MTSDEQLLIVLAAATLTVASAAVLPRQLTSILEGEALFNDATALVLYGSAITAATSGHFSPADTAGRIAYGAVVGTAIGLAVAVAGRLTQRWLDDPPIEIAISLLIAYLAYLPAEALGASGAPAPDGAPSVSSSAGRACAAR